MAGNIIQSTGRRKTSVARVTMVPGSGKIIINGKDLDQYFDFESLKIIARSPLTLTENLTSFDIRVNVNGGGFNGQARRKN